MSPKGPNGQGWFRCSYRVRPFGGLAPGRNEGPAEHEPVQVDAVGLADRRRRFDQIARPRAVLPPAPSLRIDARLAGGLLEAEPPGEVPDDHEPHGERVAGDGAAVRTLSLCGHATSVCHPRPYMQRGTHARIARSPWRTWVERVIDTKLWGCHASAMDEPSLRYVLIERKLDGSLADFVAARRASKSWAVMAAELEDLTGYKVSDETLRRWMADRIEVVSRVIVKDDSGRAA